MSKVKFFLISFVVFSFLIAVANAQNNSLPSPGLPAAGLPKAGLSPTSPFYFFDKLGEAVREFFTFNSEGKARLQITFAAERVAEIKVILETKGVEAKGLEVAQSRLQANLAKAAAVVAKKKSKGEDVSSLAKELGEKFESPKFALAQSFKEQKQVLETKENELKAQLKAVHRAGDTAKEEALAQELGKIKAQKELLELKEEDIEDELEAEEEKIEEEMEAQQKAEKTIREAEEEKQEVIDEAAEEGVELSPATFAEFNSLLVQAKSALTAGNFVEAKNLAKRAEKSLDQIEKTIEELEKQQEKREEAKEAIKDAEEEKQEAIDEAEKEGIELPRAVFTKFDRLLSQAKDLFARENYQGAKQLAEQAEDSLEDVDKEIEKLEKEKEQQEERTKEEQEKAEDKLKEEPKKIEIETPEIKVKAVPLSKVREINITNGGFEPLKIEAEKGMIVRWFNRSDRESWPASAVHPTHNAYPQKGGCIGSAFDACRGIKPGEAYEFVFEESGTWGYHDHLNPGAQGVIVVK